MAREDYPEAESAPGGTPTAFILHHTAGRGDPASVVNFWKKQGRGFGSQYIMDRNGVIHDTAKEFGYTGTNEILNDPKHKLSNSNVVGMEIVAKNDKDVTPAQAAAAAAFIQARYPNLPVYGHGQVNPGHKEATEGMTALNAVNALRSQTPGTTINAASAPVAGALADQGPESVGSNVLSPLDLVAHFESGDRNIPQGIKDRNSAAGTPAQGHFQIIDPTWARYAEAAGVDLKKYPSAISAPREVQAQVASVIPVREWGANTKKELLAAYPWIDVNKPLGDAQAAALKNVGGGTAVATATPAAATPPPAADQPWWSKYTEAPTDKEGKPIEGAKSPVEKAIDAFTGSSNLKARMESQASGGDGGFGPGPGARNVSPGLANIAQTYGQTLNSYMQPLTWNSAPPGNAGLRGGSQAWGAAVPGLSLNSVQAPPEGLGYGISSNYGLG